MGKQKFLTRFIMRQSVFQIKTIRETESIPIQYNNQIRLSWTDHFSVAGRKREREKKKVSCVRHLRWITLISSLAKWFDIWEIMTFL